jgi:hypothetical protein
MLALIVASLAMILLMRGQRARMAFAQRRISEALRKPDLPLAAVPAEIRALEALMSGLQEKNIALSNDLSQSTERVKQAELSTEARWARAVADCLATTTKAVEALAGDADFQRVALALDLSSGLPRCANELRNLPKGPSFAVQVGSLLERGELDPALTAYAVLDRFFSERSAWRQVRIDLRAADALLVALLDAIGIQIVRVPLLSVVGPSDIRDTVVSDLREMRFIPAVQQKAARIARDLAPNELLVVDCHRPGWISERLGSRPPALAIFDPASWT